MFAVIEMPLYTTDIISNVLLSISIQTIDHQSHIDLSKQKRTLKVSVVYNIPSLAYTSKFPIELAPLDFKSRHTLKGHLLHFISGLHL